MKVLQIGVGGFGRHWANILATTPEVEVVALVDTNEKELEATRKQLSFPVNNCFLSLDEALEQVAADMVLCVTPPVFHREHVTKALRAGLHVLCEKPFALSYEECRAMVATADETGHFLAVGQSYRYHPEMRTLARLVGEGAIGEIGQVSLDFHKGWYFDESDFRRTMPHPLLLDMAVHHFDLIRFITGLEADEVMADSWNPPWSENSGDTSAMTTFAMGNGARIVYDASWCSQGDFCDWNGNWHIDGDKGSLVYKQGQITLNRAAGRYTAEDPEVIEPDVMKHTSQKALLDYFIQSIERGEDPDTRAADNLRSIAMVFAAIKAAETHKPVAVRESSA